MKKETELAESQIEDMVYNFIDDSLDPVSNLPQHFKSEGVVLSDYYIRRENGILKIGVDGRKFSIKLIAEREK